MENLFESNDTLWLNIDKSLRRRKKEKEKFIELNFEARSDELGELLSLAVSVGLLLNVFELPDTAEYDTFADFLLFCKKLSGALSATEDAETAPVSVVVSEREINAVDYLTSHGWEIISRDENISDRNANKAILLVSFRRRIMKAAGFSVALAPPDGVGRQNRRRRRERLF